jgi:predicted enzyme involved in methoxymalonyl-ACP biosynthesis
VKRKSFNLFGAAKVRGFFTATEHNGPCKDMYREHGYIERGAEWHFVDSPGAKSMPAWFDLVGFDT